MVIQSQSGPIEHKEGKSTWVGKIRTSPENPQTSANKMAVKNSELPSRNLLQQLRMRLLQPTCDWALQPSGNFDHFREFLLGDDAACVIDRQNEQDRERAFARMGLLNETGAHRSQNIRLSDIPRPIASVSIFTKHGSM